MEMLGHPEKKFLSIHVGGTNGKGSTSHMMASALQEKGLKVGLYTSPHLRDFRERIRINGLMIPENEVIDFVSTRKNIFSELELSFFEMTVGLAFDYFVRQNVDIAVIEVGMGGRLDSTNVIQPLVSVITNISYDHQAFLGNTLEKIAGEKAGIIKPGIPVVIGRTQPETANVFIQASASSGSPIVFADQQPFVELNSDLQGIYQKENKQTAYYALQQLPERFKPGLSEIQQGFDKVVANTGLRGRWQQLGVQPVIICDTAHNEDGIRQVLGQIQSQSFDKLHIVWGMVNDKDRQPVFQMLPKNAIFYFTQPNLPRALSATVLWKEATAFGLTGNCFASVSEALEAAKKASGVNDLIFVGGSTFVVAEVV
jgi:dihydrofolate synthase / folylpolyglutamate synthase